MSKQKTKGFGFEREVAYSLIQGGYKVTRTGNDNVAGVDVIAKRKPKPDAYYETDKIFNIECKRYKGFSWNQLKKILNNTEEFIKGQGMLGMSMLVFKANQQPALVMYHTGTGYIVCEFEQFFGTPFLKRPVGHTFLEGEDN